MKKQIRLRPRLYALILVAWFPVHAVFAAETIQSLGTPPITQPTTLSLYSMSGGLKLSANSVGSSTNLLYATYPPGPSPVNSGGFGGKTPLNALGAPAPAPVA